MVSIPANIYLFIRLILSVVFSPSLKVLREIRKKHGLTSAFPLLNPYNKKRHYLLPTAPECDFRFPQIPENVTACGPIFLPAATLSSADSEMEAWLKRSPTVMINSGSTSQVGKWPPPKKALASALRILLQRNPNMQVLWKLRMRRKRRERRRHGGQYPLEGNRRWSGQDRTLAEGRAKCIPKKWAGRMRSASRRRQLVLRSSGVSSGSPSPPAASSQTCPLRIVITLSMFHSAGVPQIVLPCGRHVRFRTACRVPRNRDLW